MRPTGRVSYPRSTTFGRGTYQISTRETTSIFSELWPDVVDPTPGNGDFLPLGSDGEKEVVNEKRDATRTPSKKSQAKIAQMERREAEVQEAGLDEDVDDEEEEVSSTPTRRSKRKLDSASSQSDYAPSTPRSTKKKKGRPGETRRQSPLARKAMSELSLEEMTTIAVQGPGNYPWRHKGILTTFAPKERVAILLAGHWVTFELEVDADEQAERKRLCDAAAIQCAAKLKALK
ncbi:uncharacterized protein IUM83_05137 [Phytophthora cinnamomi]|uniref:uncharacterized protein n=1 Tax=Phytophthora cinnamomi TaxID=4785 RepID=UPI00355977BD|nr:hypothetical protein IUM83_05137 [Phytophthora cinnamomi]